MINDYRNYIGIMAGVLSLIAFIPYITSILKGKTKPERATWFIWSLVSIILLASYYFSGARSTIWIPLVYAVAQIFVALLSINRGVAGWTRVDKISLLGVLAIIVIWMILKSVIIVLFVALLIDFIGLIPTIVKTIKNPKLESRIAWGLSFLASIINLFALKSNEPGIISYPIYMLFNTGVIYFLTFNKHD